MIKVENVSKWFGSKKAVADISFNVEKGEVLGFLGPNGAGKSTTITVISFLILKYKTISSKDYSSSCSTYST